MGLGDGVFAGYLRLRAKLRSKGRGSERVLGLEGREGRGLAGTLALPCLTLLPPLRPPPFSFGLVQSPKKHILGKIYFSILIIFLKNRVVCSHVLHEDVLVN